MPRTGGVYSPPAGTKGVPNTTIQSVPYNTLIDDLTADANAARPVTAGGTGATSASAARAALGVEIGTNVQAYDAGLQSIAGLTTVADRMLYTTGTDVYATTALTPFARDLLGDATAAAMKTRLGLVTVASSGSANDLTTGTLSDARLPTNVTSKGIGVVPGGSFNASTPGIAFGDNDTGVRQNGDGILEVLTNNAVRATFGSGLSVSGDISATGSIYTSGGQMIIRSNANRHLYFGTAAGVTRGLLYNETADNSLRLNLYNSVGAFVRSVQFRESDGQFYVDGVVASAGRVTAGSAQLATDGNVYGSIWGNDWISNWMNSQLAGKVSVGGRAYPMRVGGVDLNFNWSGQGGQPSWLWGGNDGTNMYVYNPSNFNVNYAANAGTLNGIGSAGFSQIHTGTGASDTNLSVGTFVLAYSNAGPQNNNTYNVFLYSGGGSAGYTLNASASAQLSGTWRCRGYVLYQSGSLMVLMQRIS